MTENEKAKLESSDKINIRDTEKNYENYNDDENSKMKDHRLTEKDIKEILTKVI